MRALSTPFLVVRELSMNIFRISCLVILWAGVLFLGFLLLGTLRSLGLLSGRLEQLEATRPKRLGRDSLKPGKKEPPYPNRIRGAVS
jgi:hypothetical protein